MMRRLAAILIALASVVLGVLVVRAWRRERCVSFEYRPLTYDEAMALAEKMREWRGRT